MGDTSDMNDVNGTNGNENEGITERLPEMPNATNREYANGTAQATHDERFDGRQRRIGIEQTNGDRQSQLAPSGQPTGDESLSPSDGKRLEDDRQANGDITTNADDMLATSDQVSPAGNERLAGDSLANGDNHAQVNQADNGQDRDDDATSERADDGQRPSRSRRAVSMLVAVAIGVLVAILFRSYVGELYVVPSGSMLDTIQEGDHLWGDKIAIATGSYGQGDIVTFKDPESPSVVLVKRIIAVGGQTVELRDGDVWVDGERLDESYTEGKPSEPLTGHGRNLEADVTYPYVVPDGCMWVMGDNRTNSLDSRYFGAISVDTIIAKSVVIW